jgi:hypothetical protein
LGVLLFFGGTPRRDRRRSGTIVASSLSNSGLIYCDGGKSVQFADPFRQIASYSPQTIGKLASISHRLATIA